METDVEKKVLLVEDDERMAKLIGHWFSSGKGPRFKIIWATHLAQAVKRLSQEPFDAVLLDLGLPDSQGIDTLKEMVKQADRVPIIVLTASEYEKFGLEVVKNGGQDYLHKGEVSADRLTRAIYFAIERKAVENENFNRMTRVARMLLTDDVIRRGAADPDNMIASTEQLLVTILFADIRSFTTISERNPKEHVIKLLNRVLDEMVISVIEENGYVDKFLGDGLMAIFGAPRQTDNDWLHAARAAYKMQARVDLLNRRRFELFPELAELDDDLQIGVGIHSGTAIVGFIGTHDRCEYTAVGDCVNISSRLCSEARGGEVLVTRIVADAVGGAGQVGDWRLMQFKGKSLKTEVGTLRYVKL